MRRSLLVAPLLALATTLSPPPAHAGTIVTFESCDSLSRDPVRIRIHFEVLGTHLFGVPCCGLDLAPTSLLGSVPHRVLACEAPPGVTCTIDSSGAAHFVADPCRPEPIIDSLSVVVDGLPAAFDATFLTTGGVPRKYDWMYVPADAAVAVERRSWGGLKALYRR